MRELKGNWYDLFNGFKLALCLNKMMYAFAGLAITFLGLWGIEAIGIEGAWITALVVSALVVAMLGVRAALTGKGVKLVLAAFVVLAVFNGLNRPVFWPLYGQAYQAAVYGVIAFLFLLLVWAFFGGAITRIAAVEVATDERIGVKQARKYACKHYVNYALTVLAPIIGILFLLLGVFVWALLARLPVVDIIMMLFVPLVILAGIAVALVSIGLVVGSPLLLPALSAEGSDAFDALSRTYGYVFVKPWRYLWYLLVAFGYGLACVLVIKVFFFASLWAVDAGAGAGMGFFGSAGAAKWNTVTHNAAYYCRPTLERLHGPVRTSIDMVRALDVTGGYIGNAAELALDFDTGPEEKATRAEFILDRLDGRLGNLTGDVRDMRLEHAAENVTPLRADLRRLATEARAIQLQAEGLGADVRVLGDPGAVETLDELEEQLRNARSGLNDAQGRIDPNVQTSTDGAIAVILAILLHVYIGFFVAYVISLCFSLETTIYMLMRRHNDGNDMSEVYLDEPQEDEFVETTPAPETPEGEAQPEGGEAKAENGEEKPAEGGEGEPGGEKPE